MRYYLKVLGCQMNFSDAERIATILEKNKFKPAASIDAAGLIVFVTCGVRQSAENRVYGQIHNLHEHYPKKKIILTGCLAHRKDVQRRLKGKVDLFAAINDLPQNISKFIHNSCFIIPNSSLHKAPNNYLKIKPNYANSYTAFIPIMTGCNNFCSYCVVPYARGREYSRPAEEILKEARDLVKKGYKEIILLGQNVNSYQSEFNIKNLKIKKSDKINFTSLLKMIDAIPSHFWLTFLTSHPKDMSDELIKTIANSKKICEYISLPAQSGDNDILRKMNRKYSIEHYKNLIKKIRSSFLRSNLRKDEGSTLGHLPPAISTDIIIGFPGETKKQFENTAKLFREIKFDMAYTNQYSPRPGTAAWKLKDNVSKKEKTRREKVLTDILTKTALAKNNKYAGKIVEVLIDKRFDLEELKKGSTSRNFERQRERERSNLGTKVEPWRMKHLSHTRTQKKVTIHSNKKIPIGSFQKVKITKAKAFGLEGELAGNP